MKRFYRDVSIAPGAEGHRVLLDGRPVRTPAKRLLIAPSGALAEAIAGEWRDQGDDIRPEVMPLSRLAGTALDRMPDLRRAAIDEVLAYVDTDLVCYRAAGPLELVERQRRSWQPMLDWLEASFGVGLTVTSSILPVAQPGAARERVGAIIEPLDDWPLVGVHAATTGLGSVVLGLALLHGRIDAEAALAASLLDELFEIERWGVEPEALRRHEALRRDVFGAERFLRLLDEPPADRSNPTLVR
jgi:chaperone required for assembly of F1-ATPase